MNTYRILHGDALTMLRTLPDNSVHCVVTSPPYWGLRDYGHDGQIGLEETPDAYVARLVDVFREVRRVLRDDGTCWLNLGDSYAGSANGGQYDFSSSGLKRDGRTEESRRRTLLQNAKELERPQPMIRTDHGLKPKDLVGIPWRVAFALQADGWWLRQDIIWHKTAPMPESVTDRCTKAHEYVFLLTKAARYYYDAQAIAEPSTYPDDDRKARSTVDQKRMPTEMIAGVRPGSATYATRNKRSVWTLGPEPYSGAHFATMPETLAELCIRAGSSARGCCPACGAPWERVVERQAYKPEVVSVGVRNVDASRGDKTRKLSGKEYNEQSQVQTIGWRPTCTHEADAIPCTVLDPFCGSGTTLAVSIANGRDGIGIELNAEYIRLAEKRIGGTQPALFGV